MLRTLRHIEDLAVCETSARFSFVSLASPADTSAAGSDYDLLLQRSQFIESCMKAKGYRAQ